MTKHYPTSMERHSADVTYLVHYLSSCIVSTGDGQIDLLEPLVHVAVIHDATGPLPVAAVALSHQSVEEALWDAHEKLKGYYVQHHPDLVADLKHVYDNKWEEALVRPFDGMTWTICSHDAANALYHDPYACFYVSVRATAH